MERPIKIIYPEAHRLKKGPLATDIGEEGVFQFILDGLEFNCIASAGFDWEHVSISLPNRKRCPSWEQMCKVSLVNQGPNPFGEVHPFKARYRSEARSLFLGEFDCYLLPKISRIHPPLRIAIRLTVLPLWEW